MVSISHERLELIILRMLYKWLLPWDNIYPQYFSSSSLQPYSSTSHPLFNLNLVLLILPSTLFQFFSSSLQPYFSSSHPPFNLTLVLLILPSTLLQLFSSYLQPYSSTSHPPFKLTLILLIFPLILLKFISACLCCINLKFSF